MCWPDARKFEGSDIVTDLVAKEGERVEGRILICNRTGALHEMEEDMIVGILLAFLIGNSVAKGPGGGLQMVPAYTADRTHLVCTNRSHCQTITV